MAVVLYQRSEPRYNWLPLLSQQIRLRNLSQLILINGREGEELYFTLHNSPMSAPFYTSSKVLSSTNKVTIWGEIQVSLCATRLSASNCIIRVWTANGRPEVSWGVHFRGLHYLGMRVESWNPSDFAEQTLIFVTPFGSFTSLCSLMTSPVQPQRFLQLKTILESSPRSSYTLKNLVALHHLQRSVLEEHALGDKFKMDIGMHGFVVGSKGDNRQQPTLLSERLAQRAKIGRQKLRLKEEIEALRMRVNCLTDEKGRAEGRVRRLKKETSAYTELSAELISRMHNFNTERTNLNEQKAALISKGQTLGKFRASVFLRKKQLISEILQIYPLSLVEGSRKYSINGVQLPNAEHYANETGSQISVALGYTAHLTAMLAFFLDIPCRYPIRHFGSRSRINDHITVQIPDKEREFPLYFKGKRDVYCAYAVYLLNKNVAQLRWYCGLSTPDLRATLPNLVELLTSRLVIPGWPPNLGEALEIAQEITEDIDSQFLENEFTLSLDKGLDKMLSTGNMELQDSLSDGNPGANSTALGDIQHGRGQDRFLSGWKKKTYVELATDDFDPKWLMDSMNLDFDSGRRFSLSNSSPPSRPPVFIITDDTSGPSRRRRIGQVEPPPLDNLEEGKMTENSDFKRHHTPSKDIMRLELDIKEFERKKSRGTATSLGIPFSTESHSSHQLHAPPTVTTTGDGWVTDDEHNISDNSSQILSPPISNSIQVQHSEACNPAYHIPPPVDLIEPSLATVQPENNVVHESTQSEEQQLFNFEETKEFPKDGQIIEENDCKEKCDKSETSAEDSLLWMRTEALLGSSQSFNLVRRRLSTSEST